MSRSDHRPIAARAAITILCLGILYWNGSPLLNLAAAAPLLFYLPGWAVLRAVDAEPDGWFEKTVLTVTLSMAIVIIAGLALHPTDSITRSGWLVALGAIILVACMVSLARRRPSASLRPVEVSQARPLWPSYRPWHVAIMAAAVVVTAAAVALSIVTAFRHREFYYTQTWIVPKQGAPGQVVLGLRNEEGRDESYAIELLVDHHLVQTWSEVSLKPGEIWTTTFEWAGYGVYPRAVPPLRDSTIGQGAPRATISERVGLGANPQVEALVYRSSSRSVIYRHVWTAPQCATGDDARGRPPCAS